VYDANGRFTRVNVPFEGVTDTFLYGINSVGIIVGSYIDARGTHGFINVNGVFTTIEAPGTPPGIGTILQAINDTNQILVFGATTFLGTLTDLSPVSGTLTGLSPVSVPR